MLARFTASSTSKHSLGVVQYPRLNIRDGDAKIYLIDVWDQYISLCPTLSGIGLTLTRATQQQH